MPQRSGLTANDTVLQSPQYAALEGLTASDTAENSPLSRFCEPVESNLQSGSSEDAEDELTTCWKAVIAKAADSSYKEGAHSPLAALLVRLIQRRSDEKQSESSFGEVQGMKVWRDLPTFGWQVRDAWNFAADDSSPEEEKRRWINVNAFVAILTHELHDKSNDSPDLSLFCIWTARDALEEENVSETGIAAAAVWFKLAASTILDFCKQKKSFEGKMAKGGFSHKEQGWTGFSNDRWQIWEQRLRDLVGQAKDGESKQLVQQAVQAMERATGSS